MIWLRRVDSSGIRTLKHPIRVVAPSSAPDALRLMDLPDELFRLVLHNAITRSPWPGGWAVVRLVSRRVHRLFLEVAADLPRSLGWLLARSSCQSGPGLWDWSDYCFHDACPPRLHLHMHPPLACVWEGRLLEVHLRHVGLEDDGFLRLLGGLHAQPRTRLLEVSYNPLTFVSFKALTNGMMFDDLMPELKILLMRECVPCIGDPFDTELEEDSPELQGLEPEEREWWLALSTFEHSERRKALSRGSRNGTTRAIEARGCMVGHRACGVPVISVSDLHFTRRNHPFVST